MNLLVFRSLWGCNAFCPLGQWNILLPELKRLGYHGVEASFGKMGADKAAFLDALAENKLELIIGVFTSWQDYKGGDPEEFSVSQHLENYREQLLQVKAIREQRQVLVWVNVHSGSDRFSESENESFFEGALALEFELNLNDIVSHETHRGRSLFNPFSALRLCRKFPNLKLTADFSHWVLVGERSLTGAIDSSIIDEIITHCRHIHARVGTVESPQVIDPRLPEYSESVAIFQNWWDKIIDAARNRGSMFTTLTPEYGPSPYTPTVPCTKSPLSDSWDVCNWVARCEISQFHTRKLFAGAN